MRNRYKKYLEYVKVTKTHNTYETYRTALSYFPTGSEEEIKAVLEDESISDSTKSLRLRIFKAAQKFYGYWNQDYAMLVDGFRPNEEVQPCPTAEEVARMISIVKLPHQRMALMLMAYNGLRVSEVANLRVEDVDIDKRTIKLIGTKGKRDAVVPIVNPILLDLIAKQIADKETGMTVCGICVGTLKNLCHSIAKKCGYPYHAHSLRRFFANTLKKNSIPIEDIQTLMRHKSIMTTRRYLNIDTEDSRNVLEGVAF